MRVYYKNKIYYINWPKQFNSIIKKAAKKYKLSNNMTDWKQAEADGALKGLPKFLTLRDISHRNSLLRHPDKRKTRSTKKQKSTYNKNKIHLFNKIIPNELKKYHEWKPKQIWTERQKDILIKLTKKYRKSEITINWQQLTKDPKIKKLPYQNSFKLMKYYGQKLKRKMTKKQLKKKRKNALRYKYENYKKYKNILNKRQRIIKEVVNEFLQSKISLR